MSLSRANAVRLRRKLAKLERNLERVQDEVMGESALEFVENVGLELSAIEYERQVGFDPDIFMDALRNDLSQDADGVWNIDIINAGGDADDFEAIADVPGLWHMGRNRSDAFARFIYSRADDRSELAENRQAIWDDKAPQWYILNYGGGAAPVGPVAPTHFIEKAADLNPSQTIRRIMRVLSQGIE